MRKKLIWSFLILLTIGGTYAANFEKKLSITQIDSLRNELNNKKGTDKISIQMELALQIMGSDKNEAQILANSALLAAKNAKNKNLEMHAFYILGRISDVLNNKAVSEAYYDSAYTIAEATGDNWNKGEILYRQGVIKYNRSEELKALEYFNAAIQACHLSNNFKTIGSSYAMMGTIFRVNGLYDRSIEYIVSSRLNYEKAGFSEGKAWSSYLLGRIYTDVKLPQKALEYFQESLEIYRKQANIDRNQNGVAICYEQIGLLKLESGNFKEAHDYIDSTTRIYTENKSAYGLSNSLKNLGMIEYSMGNFELAEKYLNESLKVKNEVGDLLSLPTIHEYLGLCLIGKNQIDEGLRSLKRGLTLAISNNQKRIQLNIYSKLTEAYLSINDLKNAFICQRKQIEIQDGLLLGAANIKIEQLQAIYEIDKKNGLIIELEKQNEINSLKIRQQWISKQLLIIGIFIALLISVSIYWFYTKIRQKNLELRQINAAKDKFFAIIAHDLRGPTGNLSVFLEYLNDTFNEHSPAEIKEKLVSLSKSSENISALLENLLIWAQSQLNKVEFIPAELRLSDVIHHSIKGLKQTAGNKQIDIKLELNDQILVLAESNMLETIMRNLVSNAIKFTNRGGLVLISTEVKNRNNALIQIIDNGVGIEESLLSQIFDITNAHHTPGTEKEKSTGLGLMIVKDFIEKNKGTVKIESQIGKGTTASFTLPLSPGQ
jgi:signal transduction histidine kinase